MTCAVVGDAVLVGSRVERSISGRENRDLHLLAGIYTASVCFSQKLLVRCCLAYDDVVHIKDLCVAFVQTACCIRKGDRIK